MPLGHDSKVNARLPHACIIRAGYQVLRYDNKSSRFTMGVEKRRTLKTKDMNFVEL